MTLRLGLDIGVNSVGFALVREENNESKIEKLGVRIVTEDPNFHGKFYQGNTASKNAERRLNRGARRNLDRYQLRRDKLIEILEDTGMMPDEDLLLKISSLELYELRYRAIQEKLSLPELGRIFYHLNQKRGFQSSRKGNNEENETEYKKKLKENSEGLGSQTIGEYFYHKLMDNPWYRIKENLFFRSDYKAEFDRIWDKQSNYYPNLMTGGPKNTNNKGTLYSLIRNKTIYFQRPLKSAKNLVGKCTFEPLKRVIPKSHPLYQEFRIWQQLNNLEITHENVKLIPNEEQKTLLWTKLHEPSQLDKLGNLTAASIKKVLGINKNATVNYEKIEGNKTLRAISKALEAVDLDYNFEMPDLKNLREFENTNFVKLWHLTYSIENENHLINCLKKQFNIEAEKALYIAENVGYTSDFGSLSAKAIKKILPGLWDGMKYDQAVQNAGYKHHSKFEDNQAVLEFLPSIKPNTLKNPVVEQILNQVVNLVNNIIQDYGKPDEVRVELARTLKSNARERNSISKKQRDLEKKNKEIMEELKNYPQFKRVSGRDLKRYRLWEETDKLCLYCGQPISFEQVYNGMAEIEHIIPKSRIFSDAMSNLVLAHVKENREKGQMTAYEYLEGKGHNLLKNYEELVSKLYNEKKITKSKFSNLMMKGGDIPSDFLERQLNDTRYISREALNILKQVFPKVYSTSGSITDLLKQNWQLNHVLEEINLPVYRKEGLTYKTEIKDNSGNIKVVERIKDFDKRSDHRHHAVDALVIACTKQSYIQKLNNLNKEFQTYNSLKQSPYEFEMPSKHFRTDVIEHLSSLLISYKKPGTKVLSRKINIYKSASGPKKQITWAPRGSLHEDTVLGKIKRYSKPKDWKDIILNPQNIVNEQVRLAVNELLAQHKDPKGALAYLKKNNLEINGIEVKHPLLWEYKFTKRVRISDNITQPQIDKIIDGRVKDLILERIENYGSIKSAFKNYIDNPILIDIGKKVPLKAITVRDEGNLQSVRNGNVYLKGNHHALIFQSEEGEYQEKMVSFWEAVELALWNLNNTGSIYPIIDRNPNDSGLPLKYSLQINDLFVIGNHPNELSQAELSLSLFRVQKLSKGDYFFRQQYQTKIDIDKEFSMRRINSLKKFNDIYKIRLNHVGNILQIGE